MKQVVGIFVLVLTSACGLIPPHVPITVEELLPVGSTLRLTQSVEVPPGRTFVYIQHGKTVPFRPFNSVNIYYPYCQLTLHERTQQAHPIDPDRFLVTKVVEFEDYVGQIHPTRFASLDLADANISGSLGLGLSNDGGPSLIMYATIISLHSDKQPEVKEMVCGHWADYGEVEPLTLEELKSALGDLMLING